MLHPEGARARGRFDSRPLIRNNLPEKSASGRSVPVPFPLVQRTVVAALLWLPLSETADAQTADAQTAYPQTACPTRDDLAQGVRLSRSTPYLSSLFRRDETGLWETRLLDAGIAGPRALYAHPLAVARREDASATLGVIYHSDPAALDGLDTLRTWTSDVTLTRDGEQIAQGVFSVAWIGSAEIAIGGCRYAAWNTRDVLILGDDVPIIFEKFYAPTLGLVLRSARVDLDGGGLSTVIMDQIAFVSD